MNSTHGGVGVALLGLLACTTLVPSLGCGTISAQSEPAVKQGAAKNPFASANVGDWIRYQHTDPVGNLVIKWEETRVVVQVDGTTVKIQRTSKHATGKSEEETLTIDRAKPLPIDRLLDYGLDQKVVITTLKEGREKLIVAGREFATTWTIYRISTPGFAGSSEMKVWRSAEAPLSGIVRTEQDSGFGQRKLETEAVEFGKGKQVDGRKNAPPAKGNAPRGVKFVLVPAGEFDMGAIPMQEFRKRFSAAKGDLQETILLLADTPPIRRVKINRSFEIGAHEVTIGQFRAFVEEIGHVTDAEKDKRGGTGRLPNGQFGQDAKFTWKEYGYGGPHLQDQKTAFENSLLHRVILGAIVLSLHAAGRWHPKSLSPVNRRGSPIPQRLVRTNPVVQLSNTKPTIPITGNSPIPGTRGSISGCSFMNP